MDRLVRQAIQEQRLIRFWLDGHERIAEPHDYGIKSGVVQLLVYQTGGSSKSGDLPNWRWVRLGKASDFEVLGDHFAGGRPIPSGRHAAWERLFLRVKPSDERSELPAADVAPERAISGGLAAGLRSHRHTGRRVPGRGRGRS